MPPIDRRDFFRHVLVGSGALASGLLSACNDDSGSNAGIIFSHGVASGDPLADRVILWTRAQPETAVSATVKVTWEVATDEALTDIVSSGDVETDATRDYTVKVDAEGLQAGTVYYYRFRAEDALSPVGRTRTLPEGSVSEVKLAVFSCANYPAGYFHAYAEAAKRDDLDAAVHLGDYIYEYGVGGYASEDAEALGRVSLPANELLSIDDYRQRYAQYRSDTDLQAVHAKMPFICIWDDHEVANDAYEDGAENHDPAIEGDFAERRAVALKAWMEWLPVREQDPANPLRIYRSFDFGSLLSLHMLDTRLIGRDKQLDYADYIDPATGAFDGATFAAELTDPARQLLGVEQAEWLQGQVAASTATWQVLGQQVLMGRMNLPAPVLTPDPLNPTVTLAEYGVIATAFTTYQTIAAQLATAGSEVTPEALLAAGMTAEQLAIVNDPVNQAIIEAPSIPYNLDAWDGYAAARETVLGTARALDKNLLVLSGDTHNAWANDLKDFEGNQVGVEFAAPSVSSPGLEAILPDLPPMELTAGLLQLIPTLAYANTSQRGYMVVTLTEAQAQADWYFVSGVKAADYSVIHEATLVALAGAGNRAIVRDA